MQRKLSDEMEKFARLKISTPKDAPNFTFDVMHIAWCDKPKITVAYSSHHIRRNTRRAPLAKS